MGDSELRAANEALRRQIAERERAERRLALVHAVLHAVDRSPTFASGLRTALAHVCQATGWPVGEAWTATADGGALVLAESWCADDAGAPFTTGRDATIAPTEGLVGRAWTAARPLWCDDPSADATLARRIGGAPVRAAFAIPVLVDGAVIAVLQFRSRTPAAEDEQLMTLVSAVAVELGSVMQRRRAEDALRESERTLKTLFEYSPDAIVAVDRSGRIVQANLQAEAMFGYNRDELRGRSIETLLPERLRATHRERRAAFAAEPRRRPMGVGLELLGLRKDGTEFPVDIMLTPVDERGGVMASVRDVTERREAQRRLRRLVESASDAMMLVDRDGSVVVANGHAERLFGYDRHELLRQPAIRLVPAELHDAARRSVGAFFGEPRIVHLGAEDGPDFRGRRKDGSDVPLQVTVSPLETEDGVLAIVAIRDLSERRAAERQRELLYRELHASRERLAVLSTRLLAAQESERRTIARELHDEIGQALTAVVVNLRTLLRGSDDAGRVEIVDESIGIAQRTLRQVRDLSLDLRPSLLDDLGLGAALRWYLERQSRRLGRPIALDDGLGDVRYPPQVETTCFRIAQEAITNITRHADATAVRVAVREAGGALDLVVEDDGSGFDVAAARERATGGQSLGLLGMEERATLAGGSVAIESRPGAGTRVVARIPLRPGSPEAEEPPPHGGYPPSPRTP